ncbi:MAG: hypothetical protein KDA41_10690, partial [Planctomycetales bacterium]|nr:hypothetical protein [Planctomycetales bacterium]
QAKQRLDDARDKVGAARGWLTKIAKDSDEFETRIRQLADYAEVELPKAIATMDRIIEALEQYAAGMAPKPAVGEVAGVTTGPKKEFKLR